MTLLGGLSSSKFTALAVKKASPGFINLSVEFINTG